VWLKYRKKWKLVVIWPLKAEYILDKLSCFLQLSLPILSSPRPGSTSCLLTQDVTLNHNNKFFFYLHQRKFLYLKWSETKKNHVYYVHNVLGNKRTKKTDV
jgi:hypothetical protein